LSSWRAGGCAAPAWFPDGACTAASATVAVVTAWPCCGAAAAVRTDGCCCCCCGCGGLGARVPLLTARAYRLVAAEPAGDALVPNGVAAGVVAGPTLGPLEKGATDAGHEAKHVADSERRSDRSAARGCQLSTARRTAPAPLAAVFTEARVGTPLVALQPAAGRGTLTDEDSGGTARRQDRIWMTAACKQAAKR
jgi:hypothetical protein